MNVYQLKEELIEYAKSIGVDKIGFTTADTFDSLKDRLILQESLAISPALKSQISKKGDAEASFAESEINSGNCSRISFQNEGCAEKHEN